MNKKILRTLTAFCAALMLMGGFSVTAFAQTPEQPAADATNDSGVIYEEPEETAPLTPEGNATLVDDFGGNKQLIGVSLGLSMNFEAVTARYVDVRLERKKEVLDAYHGAVKQAAPAKAEKAEPKKAKSAAKKKSSDLEL